MPEALSPKYYPAFHQIKNHLWEIDVHNRQDLGLSINKLSMWAWSPSPTIIQKEANSGFSFPPFTSPLDTECPLNSQEKEIRLYSACNLESKEKKHLNCYSNKFHSNYYFPLCQNQLFSLLTQLMLQGDWDLPPYFFRFFKGGLFLVVACSIMLLLIFPLQSAPQSCFYMAIK